MGHDSEGLSDNEIMPDTLMCRMGDLDTYSGEISMCMSVSSVETIFL